MRDYAVSKLKKRSTIIIIIVAALLVIIAAWLVTSRVGRAPLIEMKISYEENPAFFSKDMKLIWGDTVYHATDMSEAARGKEIGRADDGYGTWRIYELKGYGRDYLLAAEGEDVWRVMSSHQPEAPWRQYILENATERQRSERLLSVTLYPDGTARLATPPISSYMTEPCYYSFEGDELLISYEQNDVIARFTVVDDNTLVFKESAVPLFADADARYTVGDLAEAN